MIVLPDSLDALIDLDVYRRCFTDSTFWAPYILEILTSHSISNFLPSDIRCGVSGTHPVFMVGDCLVVKFYTHHFDSQYSHTSELSVLRFLADRVKPELPIARVIASGCLRDENWQWPYAVLSRVGRKSYSELSHYELTSHTARIATHFAARFLRRLHGVQIADACLGGLLTPHWRQFDALLERRRAEMASVISQLDVSTALKTSLLERLATIPIHNGIATTKCDTDAQSISANDDGDSDVDDGGDSDAIDASADRDADCGSNGGGKAIGSLPRLLHGDLNADHILGDMDENGEWTCSGVIDFGDARTGEPLYDLVPLHFGLFKLDKQLLSEFLDAYDAAEAFQAAEAPDATGASDYPLSRENFAFRAMDYTLVYESDVLTEAFASHPLLRASSNYEELAIAIWQLPQDNID